MSVTRGHALEPCRLAQDPRIHEASRSSVRIRRCVAPPRDPPPIFHSTKPAILLIVDGDPVFAPVEGTGLEFVVNPATGRYARTQQGHNAYAQWGSSVATRGNQWVKTGHVTTAGGTRAAYRTSSGQSGTITRGSNGTVVRSDSGVYAGRDGNVYKRNGQGDWSQYSGGSWDKVDRAAPSTRDLDTSAKARQRGQAETQRQRSAAPRGGGGGGGGGAARGGGGGGGRRR
jgi:hypothetical protein